MRSVGEARIITSGPGASALIPLARTELGKLKNIMQLGGVQSLARTLDLPDGSSIIVASVMGQDHISIAVPTPTTAQTEPWTPPEPSTPKRGVVVIGSLGDGTPFRWEALEKDATKTASIYHLPAPGSGAYPTHLSADAKTIAGVAYSSSGQAAAVWKKSGSEFPISTIALDTLNPDNRSGYSAALSEDGRYLGVIASRQSSTISYIFDLLGKSAPREVPALMIADQNDVGVTRQVTKIGGISADGSMFAWAAKKWATFDPSGGNNRTDPTWQDCPPHANNYALYPLWAHTDTELNASYHLYSAADDQLNSNWVNYLEEANSYPATNPVSQRPNSTTFPNFGWWQPIAQTTYTGYVIKSFVPFPGYPVDPDWGVEGFSSYFNCYTANAANNWASKPYYSIAGTFTYVEHQAYKRIRPVLTGVGTVWSGSRQEVLAPTNTVSGDVEVVAMTAKGDAFCATVTEGGADYYRGPSTKPYDDYVNSNPTGAYTRVVLRKSSGALDLGKGYAAGMSSDGAIVVLNGDDGNAYRWSAALGKLALLPPVDGAYVWVTGISADGEIIIGTANSVPCMWVKSGLTYDKDGNIISARAMDMTSEWGQYAYPTAVANAASFKNSP